MQANDMANALNTILRAEGYASSVGAGVGGSVVLLPLQGVDKVVVFALDEPTLDHVEAWAVLNLFYKDNRVVIRSRPRLLVKSGETAGSAPASPCATAARS